MGPLGPYGGAIAIVSYIVLRGRSSDLEIQQFCAIRRPRSLSVFAKEASSLRQNSRARDPTTLAAKPHYGTYWRTRKALSNDRKFSFPFFPSMDFLALATKRAQNVCSFLQNVYCAKVLRVLWERSKVLLRSLCKLYLVFTPFGSSKLHSDSIIAAVASQHQRVQITHTLYEKPTFVIFAAVVIVSPKFLPFWGDSRLDESRSTCHTVRGHFL